METARAAELWSVERRVFSCGILFNRPLTAIPTILSFDGSSHFAEITPSFWQWHQDLSKSRRGFYVSLFLRSCSLCIVFPVQPINLDYALSDWLVIVIINECRKSREYCKLCVVKIRFLRDRVKKRLVKIEIVEQIFLPLSTRGASSRKK